MGSSTLAGGRVYELQWDSNNVAISGGPVQRRLEAVCLGRDPQRMLPALAAGCLLALTWPGEPKVRNEGQWIGGVETTMR